MRPIRSLAGAAVLLAGCVTMEPTVVDPDRYLGARTTPDTVYTAPAAEPALLPLLDVRFEPMERLMLVNVSDDPVYTGVELQTFAIAGGEAALALLWRVDGVVDVYMTPGFPMDDTRRRSLESLLNRITVQEAEFAYRLNVTEHGLDAGVRIRDRDGRDVRVEVVETTGTPVFGALIAPVGAAVQRPRYLPLVFLDEFALVRRRGTRIEVEIDGERRTPDTMTRLVKGPASYFSRYSTRVVIANWNERQEDRLTPVRVRPGDAEVRDGSLTYHLSWNGGHPEIREVIAREGANRVTFRFAPALPDVAALRPGAEVEGRFVIAVNDVEGVVAGEFRVVRDPFGARVEFQPRQAWQPPILRGAPWVAGYRYRARIDLDHAGPMLRAGWERVAAE